MEKAAKARWSLPAGVWLLGGVSLLNDTASEVIYPLLPFFLTTVLGASAVSLGIIEGASDAVSSVLKLIAGRISDRWQRRKPIVIAGYSLSGFARPFIGLASGWGTVFLLRFSDRIGKGIRSAPRDAMLADLADETNRGRVFGLHRAMDHSGAVLGPLLATAFLIAMPGAYRTLFALTALPAVATVILLLWVRDVPHASASGPSTVDHRPSPIDHRPSTVAHRPSTIDHRPSPIDQGLRLPSPLIRYFIVLSIFTLGNSADAFLLLRLTEAAGGPEYIPLLWSLLHLVKMSASVLGGSASDRFGRRPLIAVGWTIYAATYAGFAVSTSFAALVVWFLIYGTHFGCVEGTERALVADYAPAVQKGTAFGIYNAVVGFGSLLSSVVFGLIWTTLGAPVAFAAGAAVALIASILLFVLVPAPRTAIRPI